jgi:hypothetical protein
MQDYFIIAFYKAKLGDGKWVDDGISLYTTAVNVIGLLCIGQFKLAWKAFKNRYSHVEVWWGDKDGRFYVGHGNEENVSVGYTVWEGDKQMRYPLWRGEMFTSTMRDEDDGTVIREAKEVLRYPRRWDIMTIPREAIQITRAKKWAKDQADNNLGYNKKTIGNFFNPLRPTQKPKENEQNICSVAVQGFCWMAGMFTKWRIWSPIKLWWKLTQLGYKTKPLIKDD